MRCTPILLPVLMTALSGHAACQKTCFSDLPCETREIQGTQEIEGEVCAGTLVLRSGSVLILKGHTKIQSERDLVVEGITRIISKPTRDLRTPPSQPPAAAGGASYNRGPDTDGPGSASNGSHGGNGGFGAIGLDGTPGDDAFDLTFVIGRNVEIGAGLHIILDGQSGQDGGMGGDGGKGGDGQQGGRAIPGQPFGCASGPGNGGNGGSGGLGGEGGIGGRGGSGGHLAIFVPPTKVEAIKGQVGSQIAISVQRGMGGATGASGTTGGVGLFGWGGRGSTGCDGRVDERKGRNGVALGTRPQRTPLRNESGQEGDWKVSPLDR
jgi:hypothetical protein